MAGTQSNGDHMVEALQAVTRRTRLGLSASKSSASLSIAPSESCPADEVDSLGTPLFGPSISGSDDEGEMERTARGGSLESSENGEIEELFFPSPLSGAQQHSR